MGVPFVEPAQASGPRTPNEPCQDHAGSSTSQKIAVPAKSKQ